MTNIRPGRQKTAAKLTCLENTGNIKTKIERYEDKIAMCDYSAESSRRKHKTDLEREPHHQLLQDK
jgi:hypothetical protein